MAFDSILNGSYIMVIEFNVLKWYFSRMLFSFIMNKNTTKGWNICDDDYYNDKYYEYFSVEKIPMQNFIIILDMKIGLSTFMKNKLFFPTSIACISSAFLLKEKCIV